LGRAKAEVSPVWETEFSPEFLDAKEGVVIHCPEESLAYELLEFLHQNGATWPGGASCTRWSDHKEETAYYVRNKRILYGPKEHADRDNYQSYIKCTFYGIEPPDFDVASDDELQALLGIGGV